MKKLCFIFAVLFILLTCSCNKQNNSPIKDNQIILDLYRDILQNNTTFFMYENVEKIDCKGEYIYLNEYLNIYFDDAFQVTQFTVLDMDGNGISEVVLEIAPLSERLLLYYYNDIVYGYSFSYRGMNDLKKDGTFMSSGGAGHWSIDKLIFSTGICEKKELCRLDSTLYYVNDEEVSEDLFYSFYNEQQQKENAGWYEFNETNINNFTEFFSKFLKK